MSMDFDDELKGPNEEDSTGFNPELLEEALDDELLPVDGESEEFLGEDEEDADMSYNPMDDYEKDE